jgi:cobalt-zinc-cadmium efflux system membrane fusion protein
MKNVRILLTNTAAIALMALATMGCGSDFVPERVAEATTATDSDTVVGTDRCTRHDLPVVDCFVCDPALRDPERLWCGEHDRYEDRCFLCHPELEDPNRLWCSEHSLFEDECFLCHPEVRVTPVAKASMTAGLYCDEHDLPESECGICHPDLALSMEPGSSLKIRFESDRSASLAGVETATPVVEASRSDTTFLARVTWDENHYARVTPLAGGVLRQVRGDVGLPVSRGDILATLSSPEIAEIKSTYLETRADEKLHLAILTRQQGLVEQRISAQQDLDRAEAEFEVANSRTAAARQLLLDHGVGERAIRRLEETGLPSSDLDVVAPLDGTIVDRHAVVGESVVPGQALFRVARLDSMWLELSIPEREVSNVAAGQEVVSTFDLQPGLEARGRITWVGSSVDSETRMVMARAEVANPDRQLRHGMFGRARIAAREAAGETIWVPGDAVQYIDEQPFVFARLADDLFEVRKIAIGGSSGRMVAVAAGLDPEDEIVVAHSFALKSELLKSRLGAGCADD